MDDFKWLLEDTENYFLRMLTPLVVDLISSFLEWGNDELTGLVAYIE